MQTEIIVAIIAFIGTLAGSYFANSKTTAVMQEQIKGSFNPCFNGTYSLTRRT